MFPLLTKEMLLLLLSVTFFNLICHWFQPGVVSYCAAGFSAGEDMGWSGLTKLSKE